MTIIVAGITGLLIGAAAIWLISKARIAGLDERLAGRDREITDLKAQEVQNEVSLQSLTNEVTRLKIAQTQLDTTVAKERQAAQEKLDILREGRTKLEEAFKSLSAEALKSNNAAFLQLAEENLAKFHEAAKGELEQRKSAIDELVKPIQKTLKDFDDKVQNIEKDRAGAYEGLSQQVKSLLTETTTLSKALGSPRVRGRWGEIQLKRVVELAGMLDHCDFEEQKSVSDEEGRLRPDMIVHLPASKNIVIDAKVPQEAYKASIEATDEAVRKSKLVDHARQVRDHIVLLSKKSYWDQFQPTPEFVVLFLPSESFFSAALEQDPTLIEQGVDQRIILATPTSLIALLKAVYYGWKQENIAANARAISDLGKELYKRISDMSSHLADVGARLGKAVESYNKAMGSLETRVLPSARRFQNLDATGTEPEIAPMLPIESSPRQIQAPEMTRANNETVRDS